MASDAAAGDTRASRATSARVTLRLGSSAGLVHVLSSIGAALVAPAVDIMTEDLQRFHRVMVQLGTTRVGMASSAWSYWAHANVPNTLDAAGKNAAGFRVPPEVVTALGKGKRPPVRVTINGYTYRQVAVYGDEYLIGVAMEHRGPAGSSPATSSM